VTALRLTWLLLRKDLRIAARSREVLGLMTLFAVLCVVIFAFGFLREGAVARSYVPGVLWVTLLFSGTVGLLRLFAAEEEGGTIALVQRTVGGTAPLFFSKLLVQWLFSALVTLVAWPLVHLFFDTPVRGVATTAAALALGLLGQATMGTLAAALLARVRMREALLPLVIYPLTSPLLIAGVKVTALGLDDGDPAVIVQWLGLMVVFDAIALLASPWLHGRVVQP
jgi:heme exporter protein CcmB